MSNELVKLEWWAAVPGVPGYLVSNKGNIFSSKRSIVLNKNKSSCGYHTASVNRSPKYVHRLVAMAFIPNPMNKPQVNHKNGIKTDNRATNLEWVTASENTKHAYRTGLAYRGGEANSSAKIPDSEIVIIRNRALTEKQKDIAISYGVLPSTISKIVNHKRRNHE